MRSENEKLKEIKDIAQGIHDWWINKTHYTDVNELAEHLLGTELNRIFIIMNTIYSCRPIYIWIN